MVIRSTADVLVWSTTNRAAQVSLVVKKNPADLQTTVFSYQCMHGLTCPLCLPSARPLIPIMQCKYGPMQCVRHGHFLPESDRSKRADRNMRCLCSPSVPCADRSRRSREPWLTPQGRWRRRRAMAGREGLAQSQPSTGDRIWPIILSSSILPLMT